MTERFRIVAELGSGGEGRVLAVADAARGGAILALKETHGPRAEALRAEFDLLTRLRHPVLVPVFDWFDVTPVGGRAVAAYTQGWIEGKDLGTCAKHLDSVAREGVMLGLLGALAHLHAAGVAHLDLKPDNVLVDDGGAPFLVDFGIAARFGTRLSIVRGSRTYVAPEILAGAPVAASADLWAFGRMLAELGLAPATTLALSEPDPSLRPASAFAVARLWSAERRVPIDLFPVTAAPALVRSGGRVGHEAELAAARSRRVVIVSGPPGAGKKTFVRAFARDAETWPLVEPAAVPSFLATLARLLPDDTQLSAPPIAGGPAWEAQLTKWGADVADLLAADAQGCLAVVARTLPRAVSAVLEPLAARLRDGQGALRLAMVQSGAVGSDTIVLPPFDTETARAFVASRFGRAAGANDALVLPLVAASGGRPGAMEALAELLVAKGALRFEESGWTFAEPSAVADLPPDIEAAAKARVALLPDAARGVMAALGALRFPVRAQALATTLGAPVGQVARHLRELAAAGLVKVEADGRHALPHAALDPGTFLLNSNVRQALAKEPDLDPALAALVAGGTAGARMAAAHAQSLLQASPEAAQVAADLALELDPDEVMALETRARVADILGPRELQRRMLERLVARLSQNPEDARLLEARSALFWTLIRMGDLAATLAEGPSLAREAERAGRPNLGAEVLVHVAVAATQRGDHDAAEAHLETARRLVVADGQETLALRARIANNLGIVHAYRGRHEQALAAYQSALRLKVEEGDAVGQRIAMGNLGLTLMQLGRFAEAREHILASLALARTIGHRRGEAWSLLTLAELGLDGAAWGYALRMANKAADIAAALGDGLLLGDAHVTGAEAELQLGQKTFAQVRAALGKERAEVAQNEPTAARADLVMALCQPVDATTNDKTLDDLHKLAQRGEPGTRRSAALVLARRHMAKGALDVARALVKQALDEGSRIDLRWVALAELDLTLSQSTGDRRVPPELAAHFEGFMAAWPAVASPDPDGPCQATVRQDAAVRRLAEQLRGVERGVQLIPRLMDAAPVIANAPLAELGGHLTSALVAAIQATAAERGFLVVMQGDATRIVDARDADGEALGDAARRLPEAAVLALRGDGAKAAWRGTDGRGATLALPWRVPVGGELRRGALILQNRFVASAFADAEVAHAALERMLQPLRLLVLEETLNELRHQLSALRADVQVSERRTTEEIRALRKELETTREQLGPTHAYSEIIFKSAAMKKMLRQVDRVIATDLPVQIHGESGTGKELIARAVHVNGPRGAGPFVAQNCTAIPATLFESELFGHEKGAFTGAHRATEGLFRRAHGGTLFLDEIGDLPLELQAKLLRVLETGEVRPVGATRSMIVDVRIVSATHRDLAELITRGAFREDLYYRLSVIRIDVPPLRERPDDIPVLIEHFLARLAGTAPRLDDAALRACLRYPWPGNVRQLENEITRAALLADHGHIRVSDLSPEVQSGQSTRTHPSMPAVAVTSASADTGSADIITALGLDHGQLKDRIARLERHVLETALAKARHNKSEVARELGLSRAGLNLKLKRLGLWSGDDADDGEDESS